MIAICQGPVPIARSAERRRRLRRWPDDSSIARRSRWPAVKSMETMAATGANNGARCPKRCTATNQERPAAKAVWTSGTAALRQQRSRAVRCSRRGDRVAEVICMPLGRVGHRLGSRRVRRINFPAGWNRDQVCGFLTAGGRSRKPHDA
jgi:hypothetical protein